MSYEFINSVSWSALLFSLINGAVKYREFDNQLKLFFKLIIVSAINELIALIAAYTIGNNNVIYGFYNPLEVLLLSYYFKELNRQFGGGYYIIVLGVFSSILGYVNFFIVQKPTELNNFFLLFECIFIVGICLYSFYKMLLFDDELDLSTYSHFWIVALLMFHKTSTLCLWGTYPYITTKTEMGATILLSVLLVVNVITYLGFGTVFLLYKKMKTTHGR